MKGSERTLYYSVIDHMGQARTAMRYAEENAGAVDHPIIASGVREDIALIIDMIDDTLAGLRAEARRQGIGD
jgi:hypothetical protein